MKINFTIEIPMDEILGTIKAQESDQIRDTIRQIEGELEKLKALSGSERSNVRLLTSKEINPDALNGHIKVEQGDLIVDKKMWKVPEVKTLIHPDIIPDTRPERESKKPESKTTHPGKPITASKKCDTCGKDYRPTSNAQHFCPLCKGNHIAKKQKHERVFKERTCQKCGKKFTPIGPTQFYCSEDCGLKPKYQKKESSKTEPATDWLKKKKAEEEAARLEAAEIEKFRDHPKVDYDLIHRKNSNALI